MTDHQALLSSPEQMKINGYKINVRRAPQSGVRSVVLVHGIGVSSRYFMPLAEELAETYDVSVLDLPGYGLAPDPRHTLSIAELGEVVAAYVREAGLSAVVLVGHSMGCQIVAHAAQKHPEVCDKLILLGPTVNKWERTRALQAWRLLQDVTLEPLGVSLLVLGDYLRMGVGRYLRTSRSMIEDKIEKTLSECSQATLIVRGMADPIVPARWTYYLADTLTDTRVVEIPGAPHVVQYKQARELAKVCREFIGMGVVVRRRGFSR